MKLSLSTILVVFLLISPPGYAYEKEIILGREDNWSNIITRQNILQVEGKWGNQDLVLDDAENIPGSTTDLLIHFNKLPLTDESGNYTLAGAAPLLCHQPSIFGSSSAAFQEKRNTIKLVPGDYALFKPGCLWNDFSIEFWVYPVTLTDGESLLAWNSAFVQSDQVWQQSVQCYLSGRRLVWSFDNFFLSPSGPETHFQLKSLSAMLPRRWYHHLLRFNSTKGLLEYLFNGELEAVTYTTDTRIENSAVNLPHTGQVTQANLILGRNFTGFLDELRITREFLSRPLLFKYRQAPGRAISKIFDLEYNGTTIIKADAVYSTPGDSEVYFYYKAADQLHSWHILKPEWIQFIPGQPFPGNIQARYLQLMVELYPDGTKSLSPAVAMLKISYEPDLPPSPPTSLTAIPGNKSVQLNWNRVNEYDIGGYLIYYGNHPGVYNGNESSEGPSPVDAGNTNQFTLTNLDNGKLYYFSVIAYDKSAPSHKSIFPGEVSARPSVLY